MPGLRSRMNDALLELVYDDPLNAWGDVPVLELNGPLDGRVDAVVAALDQSPATRQPGLNDGQTHRWSRSASPAPGVGAGHILMYRLSKTLRPGGPLWPSRSPGSGAGGGRAPGS
jgi:hypothetical protein